MVGEPAAAGAVLAGGQHHRRHRDGQQQRRLDHRPEQRAPLDPAHRQHAAGEVATLKIPPSPLMRFRSMKTPRPVKPSAMPIAA